MSRGSCSAPMALRLLRVLERAGPVDALLARVPGGRAGLERAGARVAWTVIDAWVEEAARRLGANRLGPLLARERDPEAYGAAGVLLLTAPTAAEALAHSVRFQREWGDPDRFFLEREGQVYRLRFQHPGASEVAAAVLAECALIEAVQAVRWLTGRAAPARSVRFAHRPLGPTAELAGLLAVAPAFGDVVAAVDFPAALLDQPLVGVLERATAAVEAQARARAARVVTPATLTAQVRGLIVDWFGEAPLTQAAVAAQLRLTPRTLQRRLREEATSFVAIVDDARREQHLAWVGQGASLKALAYRLGFRDVSGLIRARRRWGWAADSRAPRSWPR